MCVCEMFISLSMKSYISNARIFRHIPKSRLVSDILYGRKSGLYRRKLIEEYLGKEYSNNPLQYKRVSCAAKIFFA